MVASIAPPTKVNSPPAMERKSSSKPSGISNGTMIAPRSSVLSTSSSSNSTATTRSAGSTESESDQLPGVKVRNTSPATKPPVNAYLKVLPVSSTGAPTTTSPRPGPPRVNSGAASVTESTSISKPPRAKVTAKVAPVPVKSFRLIRGAAAAGSSARNSTNSAPRSVIELASISKPSGASGKVTSRNSGSDRVSAWVTPVSALLNDQVWGRKVRLMSPVMKLPVVQKRTVRATASNTTGAWLPSSATSPRPGPPSTNSASRSVIEPKSSSKPAGAAGKMTSM